MTAGMARVVSPVWVLICPQGYLSDGMDGARLRRETIQILDVSVQTERLNAFFTDGIAGRWSSINSHFEQALALCEDVREISISDYPMVADSVKHQLKDAIRHFERLHILHETMGHRITVLLDRAQTELNTLLTEQMLARTELNTLLAEQMVVQTRHIEERTDEQVSLTKVAEILILFGGIYYVFLLFKPFTREWVAAGWWASEPILVIISALATVFGTWLYRRYARMWLYRRYVRKRRRS